MIAFIKGNLAAVSPGQIVVENHGIGYNIRITDAMAANLPEPGQEIMVYTYTYVREDAIGLFGFSNQDTLEVFRLLITVNGIGPKGGLSILSTMSADELRYAVAVNDAKSIAKSPGVGAKTAAKLILELKDKLVAQDKMLAGVTEHTNAPGAGEEGQAMSEAVQALMALGYTAKEAGEAVRKVPDATDKSVEELLKLSLKYI